MDDLNTAVAEVGGNWRNLRTKADGALEGKVIAFDKRHKTFEGEVVLNRKTKEPRWEWVFTLEVDGEADPVKYSANESAQRAIADAIRKSGNKAAIGDTLKIGVIEDPEDDRSQARYGAKWTKARQAIDVDDDLL